MKILFDPIPRRLNLYLKLTGWGRTRGRSPTFEGQLFFPINPSFNVHVVHFICILRRTDAAGEIFSQFLDPRLKMFEILVEGYSRKRKRPKWEEWALNSIIYKNKIKKRRKKGGVYWTTDEYERTMVVFSPGCRWCRWRRRRLEGK